MPNKDKTGNQIDWSLKDGKENTGVKLFANRAEIEQSKFLTTLIEKEFLTIELNVWYSLQHQEQLLSDKQKRELSINCNQQIEITILENKSITYARKNYEYS